MAHCNLVLLSLYLAALVEEGHPFLTRTGWNGYTTYEIGGANTRVIISAPHGGRLKPDSMTDRPSAGCYNARDDECIYTTTCHPPDFDRCAVESKHGDGKTKWLAWETANFIRDKLGGSDADRPHVIINHLHRSKLDANRDQDQATFGYRDATIAFQDYHGFIDEAKRAVTRNGNMALYVDVHGQNHPENYTIISMLLPNVGKNGFNKTRIRDRVAKYSSIKQLHYSSGVSMEELIRGHNSIGGLLEAVGYKMVPAPKNKGAEMADCFQGGYSLRRHSGWTVNGFQLEAHHFVRTEEKSRLAFADKLADAINKWISDYY